MAPELSAAAALIVRRDTASGPRSRKSCSAASSRRALVAATRSLSGSTARRGRPSVADRLWPGTSLPYGGARSGHGDQMATLAQPGAPASVDRRYDLPAVAQLA